MAIRSAVLIQYQRVTDGRTDRIAISISRVSVLTRDKNDSELILHLPLIILNVSIKSFLALSMSSRNCRIKFELCDLAS